MSAPFDAPIFQVFQHWLGDLHSEQPPSREFLNALVSRETGREKAVRFVSPEARPSGMYRDQYEVRCHVRGEIACRDDNWHDAFNALAWFAFPATKAAITRGHFDALEALRESSGRRDDPEFIPAGPRGSRRDTLTLFDEGGIIVASADPGLLAMVRDKEWKVLFWQHRQEVINRMRFFVLGHALHEKALHPYKEMTGRALLIQVEDAFLRLSPRQQREAIDKSASLRVSDLATFSRSSDVPPLPLMGIPGWCDNDSEIFYDDITVFRPKRPVAV